MENEHWDKINKMYKKVVADEDAKQQRLKGDALAKQLAQEQKELSEREARNQENSLRWQQIRTASPIVKDILESIRNNHPIITSAKLSVVEPSEETEGKTVDSNHSYGIGGREAHYSYLYTRTLRWHLKWGNKFGLTNDETRYIHENRYIPKNLGSKDRKRFETKIKSAPPQILFSDQSSIEVILSRMEFDYNNSTKEEISIESHCINSIKEVATISTSEFITNPEIIYPHIIVAIERAERFQNWLKKGLSYFAEEPEPSYDSP